MFRFLNTLVTKWLCMLFSLLVSKRALVFLCFLLLATISWFVKRLSSECRAKFVLNVCVYDSTNDKASRWFSETGLPVTAKATGFYIAKQRMKPTTIYVDIKNQKLRQSGRRYYMLTTSLQNDIKQLLDNEVQIESYDCDTLFFCGVAPEGITYGGNMDSQMKSGRKN